MLYGIVVTLVVTSKEIDLDVNNNIYLTAIGFSPGGSGF
jgi:hypothetical protein